MKQKCTMVIETLKGKSFLFCENYETISESDFGLGTNQAFRPNVFVDIEQFVTKKMDIMKIYDLEIGKFPFPRSQEAILALAALRGAASGFKAAEAFELLRERG